MQCALKKYIILSSIILIVSALIEAEAVSVSELITTEETVREQMLTISRELGVTCTECHHVENFKNDDKKNFKIAREHMKLTQLIKDHGFSGNKEPESTCYMCHRGKLHPDFKEPAVHKTH